MGADIADKNQQPTRHKFQPEESARLQHFTYI